MISPLPSASTPLHACGVDDDAGPRSQSCSRRGSLQSNATGSLLVSREVGREESVVGSFRRQFADGGQADIDRGRRQIPLLEHRRIRLDQRFISSPTSGRSKLPELRSLLFNYISHSRGERTCIDAQTGSRMCRSSIGMGDRLCIVKNDSGGARSRDRLRSQASKAASA
jgi:hypothetical protein